MPLLTRGSGKPIVMSMTAGLHGYRVAEVINTARETLRTLIEKVLNAADEQQRRP